MAFENLNPHLNDIVKLRTGGAKLTEIVDTLRERHGVRTTSGTLSRFLQERAPASAPRRPNGQEAANIDAIALLIEVLGEIRGRGDENRLAIEQLAGQIRVLQEVIDTAPGIGAAATEAVGASKPKTGGLLTGFIVGLIVGAVGALAVVS